jgi:endonuclease-3 related protein
MIHKDYLRTRLLHIYERLYARYGPQEWWPADSALEVCVGAILTQSASWTNVERALANLRGHGVFSAQTLRSMTKEELACLLYPSGYFNAKTRKVKAFVEWLGSRYGDDFTSMRQVPIDALRTELLSVYGIGEETADDILLYAVGKPRFVVDAFTRRILKRLELTPARETYDAYSALFMDNLPLDALLFNEYHALLVRMAKEICRKREPLCATCPVLGICPTGRSKCEGSPSTEPEEVAL